MDRLGWILLVIVGAVLCLGVAFFAGVEITRAEDTKIEVAQETVCSCWNVGKSARKVTCQLEKP